MFLEVVNGFSYLHIRVLEVEIGNRLRDYGGLGNALGLGYFLRRLLFTLRHDLDCALEIGDGRPR